MTTRLLLSAVKLAARNIGRNRRRTLLTASSVAFAVFFCTVLQGLQRGIWDHIIESAIRLQTGRLQVQHPGYREDPSLDYAFFPDDVSAALPEALVIPRVSAFVLGSGKERSRGLMLTGSDPALEDRLSQLRAKLTAGRLPGPGGVMLGIGAARFLGLAPGDTLVVLGQGFRGANAAGLLVVEGLIDLKLPELNDRMAWISLETASELFALEGRVTQVLVEPAARTGLSVAKRDLAGSLDTAQFRVLDWRELMPELVEARTMDDGGTRITQGILYALVAFGLFGTLLMTVRERLFETGVLLALGMTRRLLAAVVWLETLVLAVAGATAGALMAAGPIWYMHLHPIRLSGDMARAYEGFGMEPVLPASVDPWVFLSQMLVVTGLVTALSLYPVRKMYTTKPVEAMRS